MTQTNLTITCTDGVPLSAVLVVPEQAKAVVQINGGTGFRKEYYLKYAQYLATHGFVSLVYDYRGNASSAPQDLRNCAFNYLEYGQKDMAAVLDFLDERFPHLPKLILGHSVGGQKVGFMPNLQKVKGLVTFATGAGYLPKMKIWQGLKSYYFFYLFGPLSIALKGYVASKRFGLMEDLPRQVFLDWRLFCSKPMYFFDPKIYGISVPKGQYDKLPFPVKVYSCSDDQICTPDNQASFWKNVHSDQGVQFSVLQPNDWGLQEIGHNGIFPSRFQETLWPEVRKALENML
jgi:predicted alpha/beta hydrolase